MTDTTTEITPVNPLPSWLRWPPNCCEACVGWSKDKNQDYVGLCTSPQSMDHGMVTDSRYRCPSFVRIAGI